MADVNRWTIKQMRHDVEVWKGRKRIGTYSEDEAHKVVREQMEDGDTVHHEEVDGYRSNITRTIRGRRGWRAAT